jgi:prepilin-type N-terminal cleavage/methylation domain-containing protein
MIRDNRSRPRACRPARKFVSCNSPITVQAGFTLLEVMVAAAILGSGLAAIAAATAMGAGSASLAVAYEEARNLAENELARYLAKGPEQAASHSGEDPQTGMQWRLRARPDDREARLLTVAVEVDFFAPGGTRTLRLETREALRTIPRATRLGEGR